MAVLYIVATPIGNLKDVTFRAIEILREVDFVIVEDSRVSRKLLDTYLIDKKMVTLNMHSEPREIEKIAHEILDTSSVALLMDAGTPGIADPGGLLIDLIMRKELPIQLIPIPGACSIVSALSIAGMRANQFVFMGYVPHKKGRNSFFGEIDRAESTVVCFETPHRIEKTLVQLHQLTNKRRAIVIAREMTKMYETVYRTTVGEVVDSIPKSEWRGEFVIVIESN